jgi:N-acetylmuramoyl-L-alanine amidase
MMAYIKYFIFVLQAPRLLVGLLSGVALPAIADSAAQLEAVRVWRAPDHTRVVFDLSAPITHKVFSLPKPDRIVVDLHNDAGAINLRGVSWDEVDLQNSPIKKIRGAVKAGGGYRVVFDMRSKVQPKTFSLVANSQYSHRVVIDLYDPESKSKSESVVVKVADREQGQRDLIIAVDAGHGGEDPGALGPRRVLEKNVVLAIARETKKLFDARQGYRAVLVRDGDYYVGLSKRQAIARRHRADLFISIHADAFTDKRVSGSSVYTLSKNGASSTSARFLADSENKADRIGGVDLSDKDDLLTSVLLDMSMQATRDSSKRVAQHILGGLGGLVKLHKKNVEHAGFAVLKSPDIPSVLIETGFISNAKEAKRLASRSHQRNLSRAIVNGVVDYYAKYATEGTWVYWQKNKPTKSTGYAKQKSSTYKIQRGDTLSEVAMKNSVSLAELRRYNKLKNDKIRIGQVIKIPPRT